MAAQRKAYDVNVTWVDPLEPKVENRIVPRFSAPIKVSITVESPEHRGKLVGPGIICDLSLTGTMLMTKHRLTPGQWVSLGIPAENTPDHLCLPKLFEGAAEVCRIEPHNERCDRVALRFGESLAQDMEFAVFVNYLHGLTRPSGQHLTPPPRSSLPHGR